jgi:hypothetical protein
MSPSAPGQNELCRRVEQHDFEPETPLNFSRRLAPDQGWSLEEASTAVSAYRRFCFLAAVSLAPQLTLATPPRLWQSRCGHRAQDSTSSPNLGHVEASGWTHRFRFDAHGQQVPSAMGGR